MRTAALIQIVFCSILISCYGQDRSKSKDKDSIQVNVNIVRPSGTTVFERFKPPFGFERVKVRNNSFQAYLRNLKLKTFGSHVLYFDKSPKLDEDVYISVVDMDIDNQDLQQCADAVMRLKAEYLYQEKMYREIHFNFLSDGKPRYFFDFSKGDTSYALFRKYLRYVFAFASTSSLYDELVPVGKIGDMKIGDVFIEKGKPYGHAEIVIDMAENKKSGAKVFILAQSYMPAQETQILINRLNDSISPWYELIDNIICTPQWTFNPENLRRFKNE
jgi:hypothetical protein